MSGPFRNRGGWDLAIGATVVLLIVVLDRTSLIYRGAHGVTAWYPSTGLALYAAFRMGSASVPWLLAGFLIADLWVGGQALEPVSLVPPLLKVAVIVPAAFWMRRGTTGDRLNCEPREIAHFLMVALSLAVALALLLDLFLPAVEGRGRLLGGLQAGEAVWSSFLRHVGAQATGHLVGALLVFPLAFTLEQFRLKMRMRGAVVRLRGGRGWRVFLTTLVEVLVYSVAIIALVRFVLLSPWGWHFNLLFLAFLIVVPVSIRYGFFGAVLASVAIDVAGLAVVGFSNVRFVMQQNAAVLLVFQLFMMALLITGMFLGAAFDQIRRGQEELLRAKTAAEEASRAKTRFLQNVGHELRTPLNAILGFAQMMADEMLGPIGVARYRVYLRDILHAGQHLLGLVDRLLAVAAEDGSEESPDLVLLEPSEIARRAVEMIGPHAERAGARLLLEEQGPLPMVLGEEGRLLQILVNLIDNAIKHGPPRGTVRLTVLAGREDRMGGKEGEPSSCPTAGFVRFVVDDEGEGVPVALRTKIFERFARLDRADTADAAGGVGLGLHIVRTLVEQMGGSVWVEDAPTGGARFIVDLPADSRPAG